MSFSTNRRSAIVIGLACTALAGSGALALPRFSAWEQPVNVEALSGSSGAVNTPAVDGCVSLSRDGTEIYFNSNRGGTQDIYVATRSGPGMGFGTPERLPAPVNSSTADEFCPTIVQGGRLYFSRNQPGDPGVLMVSHGSRDSWDEPVAVGGINTALMEETAAFYEDDEGRSVMLFSRREANGAGGTILMRIEGGPVVPVPGGPNGPASDNRPSVTHDGRTIFFDSTRPGGLGGPDLWVATRESTAEPFGPAINLGPVNSSGFDARPSISWDGSELLFSSNRPGSESAAPDIWRVMRNRISNGPKVIEF